jgi:glycosyltransferase involved in cell wall biosynthesis
MKYLPGNPNHAGVLQAYFLTQYIREPTLLIAKKELTRSRCRLPNHAVLKEISYVDVALTTSSSGKMFLQYGVKSLAQKFQFAFRLIVKLREVAFLAKALPIVMTFRPHIMHCHGLATLAHGVFAKLLLRSHFVITIHNMTEALLIQKLPVLKYLLKYSDRIICVSDPIRQQLVNCIQPPKLEVITTGFDPHMFKDENRKRNEQIVAVGYLKWQKNYACMIDAMADVLSKFNRYRLLIIGDGPERAKVEAKIRQWNLGRQVHLLGNLPQDEIAKHLNESRLFIMSSIVEGYPKALLEAIACGTPAVVTTACNAEEIIQRVGMSVEPGNSRALAQAVETLLVDDDRWRKLARNTTELAQDYRWDVISNKVFNVYRSLEENALVNTDVALHPADTN